MQKEMLYFSGVNGETGQYFRKPLDLEAIRQMARGHEVAPDELRRPMEGIDAADLASAGWAVLIPEGFDPRSEEALSSLIHLRQGQAGERFRRISVDVDQGRQSGDKIRLLEQHGTSAGPVDPRKLPYYLLIVGSPEQIPYRLQFQLGVQHAVGRICFEEPEQYRSYARNSVQAEEGNIRKSRQMALFGPLHSQQDATRLSIEHLIDPLSRALGESPEMGWQLQTLKSAQATKASLSGLLGGGQTPALMLTAGHGVCYPKETDYQKGYQGALVCQDWAGAGQNGSGGDYYFSARDLEDDADLSGLIAFHFACFSAGTPLYDSFSSQAPEERKEIANRPFVAALPQRMLSLERGALAVIGHVDIAWWHSFQWEKAGQQTQTFEATLRALMKGKRVGHAMSYFGERYAELAADIFDDRLEREFAGQDSSQVNPYLWTAIRDARSYITLGDPAVRIPLTISFE